LTGPFVQVRGEAYDKSPAGVESPCSVVGLPPPGGGRTTACEFGRKRAWRQAISTGNRPCSTHDRGIEGVLEGLDGVLIPRKGTPQVFGGL
jgi:hypothetical protein